MITGGTTQALPANRRDSGPENEKAAGAAFSSCLNAPAGLLHAV